MKRGDKSCLDIQRRRPQLGWDQEEDVLEENTFPNKGHACKTENINCSMPSTLFGLYDMLGFLFNPLKQEIKICVKITLGVLLYTDGKCI